MVLIYILKLRNNKYYVGKTNHQSRIQDHFNGNGSEWTKKYKAIKVIEIIKNCDDFDEDKYTQIYMEKYGIKNVRGGTFCRIKLDNSTIQLLEKMINGANDKCFRCKRSGHFISQCYAKTMADETNNNCFRCKRSGHLISECYAKTMADGKLIKDDDDGWETDESWTSLDI